MDDDEGRRKLSSYKELGFLGSGTFAEVTRYVRARCMMRQGRASNALLTTFDS
jgi:hypothetical protein